VGVELDGLLASVAPGEGGFEASEGVLEPQHWQCRPRWHEYSSFLKRKLKEKLTGDVDVTTNLLKRKHVWKQYLKCF
jgi:hypothetical protein